MKQIQKYQCEVCHTEYAKREDAVACEKNHKIPKAIVETRYLTKAQDGGGYPVTITVLMNNGERITYKR